MKKLLGIFIFLLILYVLILFATIRENWGSNHFNVGQRIGLYGILCLGAGVLIVSGGIDLSIGSVVGLCACVFCVLVLKWKLPIPAAMILTVLVGGSVGLINGLIVTYIRLQPFVVTLCGLFIYRGAARWVAGDQPPQMASTVESLHQFFGGEFLAIPIYLWLLLVLFAITTVFLHFTIYGRYLYAIGSNERAARYSGINVDFYKIFAYVLCSMFAAIYALVYVINHISVQPSDTGSLSELEAIAGAVIGGCSLRGGDGTTVGMVLGTAIMVLLRNFTNMWGFRSELEPTVLGGALLVCAILDELLRRGLTWRDVWAFLCYSILGRIILAAAALAFVYGAVRLVLRFPS